MAEGFTVVGMNVGLSLGIDEMLGSVESVTLGSLEISEVGLDVGLDVGVELGVDVGL